MGRVPVPVCPCREHSGRLGPPDLLFAKVDRVGCGDR